MAWTPAASAPRSAELVTRYAIRLGEITHCYVCHR
jgi:hypothetical protein